MKESCDLQKKTVQQQQQIIDSIEHLLDVFVLLDHNGMITYVNRAAEDFFGELRSNIMGKSLHYFIPNSLLFIEQENRVMKEVSLENVYSTNLNKWVELNIYPTDSGLTCLIKDITFNRKIEMEFYEKNRKLSPNSKTTDQSLIHNEHKQFLDYLFTSLSQIIEIDVFINFVFDEKLNMLTHYHSKGLSDQDIEQTRFLSLGESISGTVATTKKTITVDLVQSSDDPKLARIKELDIKAYVSLPIISFGKLLGTLSFGSKTKDYFSIKEIKIMNKICFKIANSLDRMLLISELKENEVRLQKSLEDIQQSEDFLLKIIKLCPIPMGYFDTQGNILGVSDAFLKVFEYNLDEVINKNISKSYFWKENKRGLEEALSDLKLSEQVYNKEITLNTRTGTSKIGYLSTSKAQLNNKEFIICIFNDVTDMKKLEKEMLRLDQLNIVGEMAAGFAHEVRNPMTTIKGFLQLQSQKFEDPESIAYTKLMLGELDRANSIITEFLSLAKDYRYRKEAANLNEIIYELLPLIEADGIVNGHLIKTELSVLPTIEFDKKQIKQVILNLIRNGLEAMTNGGVLTIVTSVKENQEVVFSVKDEGSGIAPEILDEIWKPFFTSKHNGTGLGLAICYRIINDHNGTIVVDSDNNGTTFTITFNNLK
jgi:PAS domain S-box-containing protein